MTVPGDYWEEATASSWLLCYGCAHKIAPGEKCVATAGHESGPGAVGDLIHLCTPCAEYEKEVRKS